MQKIRVVDRKIRKNRFQTKGTLQVPRFYVFRSSKHIYGGLVNDLEHKTLLGLSDKDIKAGTKSERAFELGKSIAEKALKMGLKKVVFDRSGYLYHGRVKSLAEGARQGGLNF